MSRFFNELKDALKGCDFTDETGVNDLIDSLGENARRMLEIGIVQDKLIKLGMFKCAELLESAINDELVCKKLRELKPSAPPAIRDDIRQKIEDKINSKSSDPKMINIGYSNYYDALAWVINLEYELNLSAYKSIDEALEEA